MHAHHQQPECGELTMPIDPWEVEFNNNKDNENDIDGDLIGSIASSNQWTILKDALAKQIFD